jgi:hypothetical protein
MPQVKKYEIDEKNSQLKLYFETKNDYTEIKKILANLMRIANLGDSEEPLQFMATISDSNQIITIVDSDKVKKAGDGMRYILEYFKKQDYIKSGNLEITANIAKPSQK